MEKKWQIPEDFLDSGEIKPKTRSILMDWFIQVQVQHKASLTVLHTENNNICDILEMYLFSIFILPDSWIYVHVYLYTDFLCFWVGSANGVNTSECFVDKIIM